MATLYIVATPIGNREDITIRALKILFSVYYIAAEDTRHTGNLINLYKQESQLLSTLIKEDPTEIQNHKLNYIAFHDHNETSRLDKLINLLQTGHDIALVSDAGTPLISDPGFKLVRRATQLGITVTSIPGPNAALSALVSSGQPVSPYMMIGYLPIRQRRRKKYLYQLAEACPVLKSPPTIICYASPHRLLTVLNDILEVYGNIELTIAKELTKLHEGVKTQPVSLWIAHYNQTKPKGEFTLLFQTPTRKQTK